jgi:hypothetical protein
MLRVIEDLAGDWRQLDEWIHIAGDQEISQHRAAEGSADER